MNRAVCIHAHFYQPSRENPFTNSIIDEPDSQPFKNWNEKVFHHCYKPNIELGNFEFFNFNIGPTLSTWMKDQYPDHLNQIIEQEKRSIERFGSSNAIAQPYHHTILPLDNYRDKLTQIRWGIEDYQYLFGHAPQGMWLPETAVDLETLEIMADSGIIYTILAPWQAKQAEIDTTRPYYVKLSNNRRMTIYFYNSYLSGQVSFSPKITEDGDKFINTLQSNFDSKKDSSVRDDQLILIATDGELYGHHQTFRDKFISYVFHKLDGQHSMKIENLSAWLEQHPPENEIELFSDTSWSCHHGIERWRDVCDCTPKAVWKRPLRNALNLIASKLDDIYENDLIKFVDDPWALRNMYIDVMVGKKNHEECISYYLKSYISSEDYEKIIMLLKMQNSRQRMFTSCGWFFDDIERLEPLYNIMHSAYAVHVAKKATSIDISNYAIDLMKEVKSTNKKKSGDMVFKEVLNKYAS